MSQDSADVPAYFEDFQDYKDFCISYRGDLARIVKLTSGLLPEQALAAASRRLQHALHQCSTSSVPASVSHSSTKESVTIALRFVECKVHSSYVYFVIWVQ